MAPQIERESKLAREKALKIAREAERRSIPSVPDSKVDTDPAAQINVRMEAQEIRERAKRIEEDTPEYAEARVRVLQELRSEYAAAVEIGGLSGATTCQAVLRAAKVFGIPAEEIYGHLRTEQHLEALEEARLYSQAAQTIPTHVPDLDRGRVAESHWRRSGSPRLVIPKGGPLSGGGRSAKRPWK